MNKHNISKCKIKEAIFYSHYKSMKDEIASSSKLEEIKHEDFCKIQPYFYDKSVDNTRLAFRIRTKLVKKIPGNFKNLYKHNKDGLKCSHCLEPVMTQSHCVSCPGLEDLREGLDLASMKDMVTFIRRILIERSKK